MPPSICLHSVKSIVDWLRPFDNIFDKLILRITGSCFPRIIEGLHVACFGWMVAEAFCLTASEQLDP